MRQSRLMSFMEALANVAVGYATARLTQALAFPVFELMATRDRPGKSLIVRLGNGNGGLTRGAGKAASADIIRSRQSQKRTPRLLAQASNVSGTGGSSNCPVVAAICCATPLLAVVLGSVGLSAWAAKADYVVLPALALCLGMVGWALIRRQERKEVRDGATFNSHLPALRPAGDRDHADRRLPVLLPVQELRDGLTADGGRLLRVLLLRLGAMPADPRGAGRRHGRELLWRSSVGSRVMAQFDLVVLGTGTAGSVSA